MFARPGLCGTGIGRLGLVAASQPSLITQALAILARYGSAANLYLPGVGAINGITAGNWLDSAGTTAATVDGQVGLVVSAGKYLGPELVANGTFENGTNGWISDNSAVISSVGGNLRVTHGGTSNPYARQSISTVIGRTYSYSVTVRTTSSSAPTSIRAGTAKGGGQNFISSSLTGARTVTAYFVATSSSTVISLLYLTSTPGDFADFDDVSVKEMPGAHLTQSTAANRPVLRRGLVNQLLWSGNFSNATWLKSGVTVTSGQADSSGGFSASRLQAAGGAYRFIYENTTWAAGQPATLAIRVKSYSGASQAFRLAYGASGGLYSPIFTANDNWQIFTVSFTSVSTEICAVVSDVYGAGASAFDLVVERVGLFQGTVTASQILAAGGIPLTTTAAASSATGPFAWQFDGSNDSFTSTMTPGNAGFVCASANVTDSGVLRTLLGAGAGSDASSGVWLARAASNALTLQVGNGTTRNSVSAAYPVATNAVASAGWDASAMFVGINGTETSGAKSVDCTSSNTMNIGVLTGTTLPMLGTISGGAIIMPTVLPTVSERATLRQLIASLSGVTL